MTTTLCKWCQYCVDNRMREHEPHKEGAECECNDHCKSTNEKIKSSFWYGWRL